MRDPSKSAIARVVEHHGGPTAVSTLLDGAPVYQEIQRWVKRGWAAPKHFLRLEPLLKPLRLTVRDLYADLPAADAPRAQRAEAERPTACGCTDAEITGGRCLLSGDPRDDNETYVPKRFQRESDKPCHTKE